MSKINIYINSKNRKVDETASNFSIIIPDGLLRINKDEYFTMSVNSFYCYNDFYQCTSNCNGFIIIVKNNVGEISATSDFYIPVGNPNVYDILAVINAVLKPANVLSCSYDNTKNKFTYTRLLPQTNTNYTLYINALNAGNFLGFKNNTDILISFDDTICTNPININSIIALSIGIDGDISFNNNNMESSINNSVYKASDLIFQTSVNVPKGYLIDYQNIDGGDSFKFTLGNHDRIKYFILSVYDQDGNTITDMTDYIIHIQFTVNKKSQQELLLKSLVDYNKQSYLIIGHIFDILNNIYNYFLKKLNSNT